MPGTNTAAIPFTVWQVVGSSDALPLTKRMPQKASLTIKRNTPVVVSSGYIIERTAISSTAGVIAGVCDQFGDNLASDGVASIGGSSVIERTAISSTAGVIAGVCDQFGDNLASDGVASIGGSSVTFGSVPNQSAAVNIPIGAPPNDGLIGVLIACDTTIFQGVTDAAHTTAATDIGSTFGITKDSTTGYWFIDTTITATASGACVIITDFVDPVGVGAFGVGTTGGRLAFKFIKAYQQIFQ
jgi:hypothetical protein